MLSVAMTKSVAGGGADIIAAGSGNDMVDAGDGNDQVDGSTGHDEVTGGNGTDEIGGGAGNDRAGLLPRCTPAVATHRVNLGKFIVWCVFVCLVVTRR